MGKLPAAAQGVTATTYSSGTLSNLNGAGNAFVRDQGSGTQEPATLADTPYQDPTEEPTEEPTTEPTEEPTAEPTATPPPQYESNVTLNPVTGPVGTKITATGNGWIPGNWIEVGWKSTNQGLTKAIADDKGNFTVSFTVPANATAGKHQIVFDDVSEDKGYSTERTFTVTAPQSQPDPTATLDPTFGPRGAKVTATGSGWPAGDRINVWWDDGTQLAQTTADGNGNIRITFTVPANVTCPRSMIHFTG